MNTLQAFMQRKKNIATLLPATRQVKRRGDKPLYLVAEKSVAS